MEVTMERDGILSDRTPKLVTDSSGNGNYVDWPETTFADHGDEEREFEREFNLSLGVIEQLKMRKNRIERIAPTLGYGALTRNLIIPNVIPSAEDYFIAGNKYGHSQHSPYN